MTIDRDAILSRKDWTALLDHYRGAGLVPVSVRRSLDGHDEALRAALTEAERERDEWRFASAVGERNSEMLMLALDENARLREVLKQYGKHDLTCRSRDIVRPQSLRACTCGLDEALKETP